MLLVIFLDKRLRNEEQVKEKLGLAYLGGISSNGDLKSSPIRPSGSVAHELGDVLANLRLTRVVEGPWQAPNGATFLITSPQSAEGKSTLAVGLAAIAARSGQAVVVVDGNLNKPSTHLTLGMNPVGVGLAGLLRGTGREAVDDAVVRSNVPGLWLVPVGAPVEGSALLLEQKMPAVLAELRKKADLVIIDGPPLLSGADASVLATMVDGVALVVDARHDKLPLLKRAKEVLSTLTTTPVGIVLNRKPGQRKNRYFATAVPAKVGGGRWAPVTAYEFKGNGNGHSIESGNGQRVEGMTMPSAMVPPVASAGPVSPPPPPTQVPPSPGRVPSSSAYPPYQRQMPPAFSGPGSRPSKTPPPLSAGKEE
jgi:capsular exopolysaccharide synthesis family protein